MTTLEDDIRRALDAPADPASLDRLGVLVRALSDGSTSDVLAGSGLAGPTVPRVTADEPRRARVLAPLLAVAAVLAVAVATVAAFAPDRSSDVGAPRSTTPSLSWALRMHPVAGLQFTRYLTTLSVVGPTHSPTIESTVRFTDAGSPARGEVTYYQTALEPRSSNPRQKPITIDGRTYLYTPGDAAGKRNTGKTTPWDQANNSVAPDLIGSTPDGGSIEVQSTLGFDPATRRYDQAESLRLMVRVLDAAEVGRTDPPTVPFRIRSHDARLYPNLVEVNATTGMGTFGLAFPRTCLGFTSGGAIGPRSGRLDGSYLAFCRFETQSSRTLNEEACGMLDGHPGASGRVVVRNLPDGTSLCGQVDPEHNDSHISLSQLERYVAQADVTPELKTPATWLRLP